MVTVHDLNQTVWYRFVKVVYALLFVVVYLVAIGASSASFYSAMLYDTNGASFVHYLSMLAAVVGVPVLFWLFVGLFRYIALGRFELPLPQKIRHRSKKEV